MPDFLYIGAPRAGSTWLAKVLQQHPEIWVPPSKNILYFHPRFQIYRLKMLKYFWKDAFFNSDEAVMRWYKKFFDRIFVNDSWYFNLFPANIVSGEIAEAYCSLKESQVEKIYRLMPDIKIIFILRNPVERSLSHARLSLKRKKIKSPKAMERAILRHINHPSSEARTTYTRTLDLWQEFFPREQFLICFYEDLCADPSKFLEKICDFLCVPFRPEILEGMRDMIVNASGDYDIPDAIRLHTAIKYAGEIEELARRYDGPAKAWKKDVEAILKSQI